MIWWFTCWWWKKTGLISDLSIFFIRGANIVYKQASIKQWDEDDVLYLITPACYNVNIVDGRVPSPKVACAVQVRKFSVYLIIALVGRQIGKYNHFKLDKGYFKVLEIYKSKWLISSMKSLLYVPSVTLHISTIMFQVSVALVQKSR